MITIITKRQTYDWHIGKNTHLLPPTDEITCVVVDGDELILIADSTQGLPIHRSKPIQIWFGDHAQFIVANCIE